jgi:predicted transcriptional regulator
MLAGNPMDNEEALIALEKVQPRFMFPMHSGGSEYVYKAFARETVKKKLKTTIICAENRGDRFRYRDGNKVIEAN